MPDAWRTVPDPSRFDWSGEGLMAGIAKIFAGPGGRYHQPTPGGLLAPIAAGVEVQEDWGNGLGPQYTCQRITQEFLKYTETLHQSVARVNLNPLVAGPDAAGTTKGSVIKATGAGLAYGWMNTSQGAGWTCISFYPIATPETSGPCSFSLVDHAGGGPGGNVLRVCRIDQYEGPHSMRPYVDYAPSPAGGPIERVAVITDGYRWDGAGPGIGQLHPHFHPHAGGMSGTATAGQGFSLSFPNGWSGDYNLDSPELLYMSNPTANQLSAVADHLEYASTPDAIRNGRYRIGFALRWQEPADDPTFYMHTNTLLERRGGATSMLLTVSNEVRAGQGLYDDPPSERRVLVHARTQYEADAYLLGLHRRISYKEPQYLFLDSAAGYGWWVNARGALFMHGKPWAGQWDDGPLVVGGEFTSQLVKHLNGQVSRPHQWP